MAYTPLNWQSGDIVTAEKLNQMKGGVLFIRPTSTPIGGTPIGDNVFVFRWDIPIRTLWRC